MIGSVLVVGMVGQQYQGHCPGALLAGWQYKVQCPWCPTPGSQGTMGTIGGCKAQSWFPNSLIILDMTQYPFNKVLFCLN